MLHASLSRWGRHVISLAAAVTAALVPCGTASADIEAQFANGYTGTIVHNGNMWVITVHDHVSILDCTQFTLSNSQLAQFLQPSSDSRLLARISGGVSDIFGTITANGIIYLVNPAGIYFHQGSVVNVGGMYAAAGHVDASAWVAAASGGGGPYSFTDMSGTVTNEGTIQADQMVHLIGAYVANHGTIEVRNGGVLTMLAGDSVQITELSTGLGRRVSIRLDGHDLTGDVAVADAAGGADTSGTPRVENTGTLRVRGAGQVVLGAGDLYSLAISPGTPNGVAIRNTGSIEAEDSSVQLSALSGTVQHGAGGVIEADDLKMEGEAIVLESDITARTATFDNQVVLGDDVTISGSSSVDFLSTLDSEAGETNDLTVANGDATFHRRVGMAAGGALGDVWVQAGNADFRAPTNVTGAVTTGGNATFGDDATAGSVDAGGYAEFGDRATVGTDVTAGDYVRFGDDAFVGGSVESANDFVEFGENAAVGQDVTALNGTITFGDSAVVAGDVEAGSSIDFMGDATLGGDVTTADGDIGFGGDVLFNGAAMQTASAGGADKALNISGNLTKGQGDLRLAADNVNFVGADSQSVTVAQGYLDVDGNVTKAVVPDADIDLTLEGHDQVGTDDIRLSGETIENLNGDLVLKGNVDLYGAAMQTLTAGDELKISGNVTKDMGDLNLVADLVHFDGAGSQSVTVTAGYLDVDGNVTKAAGADLTLEGHDQIGTDDIRLSGETIETADGNLVLKGNVDLYGTALQSVAAGGAGKELKISGNVKKVQGDLLLAAGTVRFDGSDSQSVTVDQGYLDIDGNVSKSHTGPGNDDLLLEAHAQNAMEKDIRLSGATIATVQGDLILDGTVDLDNDGTQQTLAAGGGGDLYLNYDVTKGDGNLALEANTVQLAAAGADQTIEASNGFLEITGDVISTGSGQVILEGHDQSEGRDVRLHGNVDVANGLRFRNADAWLLGADQTVDAGAGTLTADGDLRKATAGALILGGDMGIHVAGAVAAVGALTFEDDATLAGDVTANGITFEGTATLDGPTAGPAGVDQTIDAGTGLLWAQDTLTKSTAGSLTLGGDAGVWLDDAVTVTSGNLTVADAARIASNVTTSGAQSYQGAAFTGASLLTAGTDVSFAGDVEGPGSLTISTGEDLTFGADVGAATPLARLQTTTGGFLRFSQAGGAVVRVTGDILLNQDLGAPPEVATIGADGDLQITAGGTFAMGRNQKLSVLGTLDLTAQTARLSDINTLNDMRVTANAIQLLTRQGGTITDRFGADGNDIGLDFVAGGRFFFSVTPTLDGPVPIASFANPNGDGDATGKLRPFIMQAFGQPVIQDDLLFDGTFFDLRAQGPTNTNVAEAIAAAFPRESELEEVRQETALPAGARRELADRMDINPRLLGPAELAEMLVGRAVYLDSPATSVVPEARSVVVNRLSSRLVQSALDRYQELGSRRTPEEVKAELEQAWTEYQQVAADADEPLDPARFDLYLRSPELMEDLRMLAQILHEVENFGLTPAELEGPMRTMIANFTPQSFSADDMRRLLEAISASETAGAEPAGSGAGAS